MQYDEQYDPTRADAVRRAVQHAARLQHGEQGGPYGAAQPDHYGPTQLDQGGPYGAAQFDQAVYLMCMMPQPMADTPSSRRGADAEATPSSYGGRLRAAADAFEPCSGCGGDGASPVATAALERAATEPSAARSLGAARAGAAAPKATVPAPGRKAALPLAPLPLARGVTEPAATPGSAAAEKRALLRQDALAHRPTAASMQRQAVQARMLRALAGGRAPLLLARRKAQQQGGDHSTLSALNIDGSPGAAVGEARFLAELGNQLRTSQGDEKKLLKASPGDRATAAPEVDPDASTAEEDESPCAGADSGLPGFAASRELLLSYRRLAEPEAPELGFLRARRSCGPDATAAPLEAVRQRSEPAWPSERQLSAGSPAARARGRGLPSAEELRRREVQSLLNKVCPENVASVIGKMSAMEVRTADAMEAVIELIFKKALAEPHYCETYADIVFGLKSAFPEFQSIGGSKPLTFKSSVLNICQHEFEELVRAPEPSEGPEQLEHERQERRKRMRANMRFIGHLFLRQLLSFKVIGSVLCELTLVERPGTLPEEHAIECACELLNAVGPTLESLPAGQAALAAACGRVHALSHAKTESGKQAYSRRVQFTMQDILDARAAGWTRKSFKTSAETKELGEHHDAAAEGPQRAEQQQEAPPPPRARSPGTPRAPRTAWSTPPSTPRGPARAPSTPPPARCLDLVTPLLWGLERNCLKQVRLAIEASPEAAKEPLWEPRFDWPLCAAVRLGCSEEIVRLLIENGARVNVTDVFGQSPLQLLSKGTEKKTISDPLTSMIDPLMNMGGIPDIDEWTERMRWSVNQLELGVATALLDSGADPGAIHDDLGKGHCSGLELARRFGKQHLVDLYDNHCRQQQA